MPDYGGWTKVSGVWKAIEEIHTKVIAWKEITDGWVNISGVWKRIYKKVSIPENLICFFTSGTHIGWDVLDGVSASPDLITNQVYPRAASAEGGSEGGSHIHNHGSVSPSLGWNTNSDGWSGSSSTNVMNRHAYHTTTHTTSSGNNEPPYIKLEPAKKNTATSIPTNAILFFDGTVPTGWSEYTSAQNRFIKCSNANHTTTGGGSTHSHSSNFWTGYRNDVIKRTVESPYEKVDDDANHRHYVGHSHGGHNSIPTWYGLIAISPDSETSEIPSGVVAFFTGSVVPEGWTEFTAATSTNKFIEAKSSSGGTGGSNSHSGGSHGQYSASYTSADQLTGSSNSCVDNSGHAHYISGGTHPNADNIPKYRDMLLCKKD